jgi:aspartyl-tRNA(Asn)/glutamyl-tRNA(Gln) amidotransferase subunit A
MSLPASLNSILARLARFPNRMNTLTDLSLKEMQQGLQGGKFSSRELVQASLDRISTLEPSLRAFLHVAAQSALQQAAERDNARKDEGDSRPLLGIPVAIKDVLTVEGLPCTCGSKILEGFVSPYTATSVRRLLDAGIVIVGKTNTDEFAMGSSTENSAYGVTHNPWDLSRVPGGSSGGSAAAVAARCVPAALGTDTGGSVRQPASLCGVTGLKTTYGRVSRYGLVAFASSLDTVGAFGRSAEDVADIFAAMAGNDPRDATSARVEVPVVDLGSVNGEAPLRGLKIGVPTEYDVPGLHPDVAQRTRAAIEALAGLGAQVEEVSLPHTEYALPVYYILAPAEASANLARYDGIRYGYREPARDLWDVFYKTRGRGFGPEVTRRIIIGTYALSAGYYDAYYGQAQRVRTLIRRDFDAAFKRVDLIATPTSPGTAFKIGAHADDPLAMYLEDVFTLPANLAGLPGISFNVGFDRDNLPVGLQLIGPPFREDILLRAAHAYQRVTDWHTRAPKL